jgi:hypothetical protein
VTAHGNHTTSGIIGFRFACDVLSANGLADVAYALLTQTTYPSIGYEIKGGLGEPATTLWELWDGDHEGPSMNSRNHIMFGGPGKWLHTYVGGIDNTPGTNGFEDIVFAPPATLVAQAVHKPTKAANDTTSPPLTWSSSTRVGPRGTMALFWSVDATGKITAQTTAPPNTVGTTVVPLAGADPATVTVSESGQPVWAKGAYVVNHLLSLSLALALVRSQVLALCTHPSPSPVAAHSHSQTHGHRHTDTHLNMHVHLDDQNHSFLCPPPPSLPTKVRGGGARGSRRACDC